MTLLSDPIVADDPTPRPVAKSGRWLLSRPLPVAVVVFIVTALLAGLLISRQEQYRLATARLEAAALASERAQAVAIVIERARSIADALAVMTRRDDMPGSDSEAVASRLVHHSPGIVELHIVRSGVDRPIFTVRGDEYPDGAEELREKLLADNPPASNRKFERLTLLGPVFGPQGESFAALRVPIVAEGGRGPREVWGFAIVVLAIPRILSAAQLGYLQERGYAYELTRLPVDGRDRQVLGAAPRTKLVDPVEQVIPVADDAWTLRVSPIEGWTNVSVYYGKGILGLVLSVLLTWQALRLARLIGAAKTHEAQLELRVGQRTADLQRFAEITAHHLREPARRIANYAGLLQVQLADKIDDGEVFRSLEFMTQQSTRLQNLLHDLELYLAADQPRGNIEPCSVQQVLASVLKRLTPQIAETEARIRLGDLPPTWIDAPRLADLFRIAIDNALRHARGAQRLCIDIAGEHCGHCVRYHIDDNGPGIDREYRSRVFRIFERLSSTCPGTGAGLAIFRRIAESAGGRASLEEAPGGGCRVVLELPTDGGEASTSVEERS